MLKQTEDEIVTDPRKYLTTIHGRAGVGKTSWGVQIPGHYVLMTEAGTQGLRPFGEPIFSWEEFLIKIKEIVEAHQGGFKGQREITTVVIDTYERLYKYAGEWVAKNIWFTEKGHKSKVDRIEDAPYGKGFSATSDLLIGVLQRVMLHGLGIVVIAHSKQRTIKYAGRDIESFELNLYPSAAQALIDASNAVGYFELDEEMARNEQGEIANIKSTRTQYWQGAFARVAKHQLKGFPEKLPLERNMGYSTYLEAFKATVTNI